MAKYEITLKNLETNEIKVKEETNGILLSALGKEKGSWEVIIVNGLEPAQLFELIMRLKNIEKTIYEQVPIMKHMVGLFETFNSMEEKKDA